VLGVVLILVALVALVPVFLIGGGVLCAVLGQLLTRHAESTHQASPLIDCNK
jgi:hypothetical protein